MKKKIIIVSEHQEFQELLESFLSRYFDVKPADNIEAVLVLIENGFNPHLIIGDTILTSSPVKEFITAIKSKPALSVTPVIILSGKGHEADKRELLQAGVADYLKKPFSLAELENRINSVLENHIQSH
jgi:DNA-binding response OmpR family regulator